MQSGVFIVIFDNKGATLNLYRVIQADECGCVFTAIYGNISVQMSPCMSIPAVPIGHVFISIYGCVTEFLYGNQSIS